MKYLRKKRKISAIFMLILLASNLVPIQLFALTSGPTQPEAQSFEPAGSSQMVDLFTGDFTYNIPLFELPGPNGGYPFNLAYQSGATMEQESSWVGLGWILNAGAINRQMRGVPDDFDGNKSSSSTGIQGDYITNTIDMKDDWTVGITAGANLQFVDIPISLNANAAVYYNSYKGVGLRVGIGFDASVSYQGFGLSTGIDLSSDSHEGANISPTVGLDYASKVGTFGLTASANFNSIKGCTDLSFGTSYKYGDLPTATASVHFANTAYTPIVPIEMIGGDGALSFDLGAKIPGVGLVSGMVGGNFSIQKVKNKNQAIQVPAYGYSFLEDADDNSIMDFNREKDGQMHKESPNISIPSLTHDNLSILGQGVGGTFRPYRSDIGTVHDKRATSDDGGATVALTLGAGSSGAGISIVAGGAIGVNYSDQESGDWYGWTSGNNLISPLPFVSKSNVDIQSDYETAYLKMQGDATASPYSADNYMGNDHTMAVQLGQVNPTGPLNQIDAISTWGTAFVTPNGNSISFPTNNYRQLNKIPDAVYQSYRKPRATGIVKLTNADLANGVLGEYNAGYYTSTDYTTSNTPVVTSVNRTNHSNHIGAYEVVNQDGNRYVYALPVYDQEYVEEVYTCADIYDFPSSNGNSSGNSSNVFHPSPTAQDPTPTNSYDPGICSSLSSDYNNQGGTTDKFHHRKQISPFTTSHLLTAILGPDYVDLTGDGPTDDDLGYWVKFNYVNPLQAPFQWRIPFTGGAYDPGTHYFQNDDKASYTYGTKDAYYLASAETKTHIAIFSISQRVDGRGAINEQNQAGSQFAAANTSYSYELDKISLYSKSNYLSSVGTINTSAALMSAHFVYDQTNPLCKNVDNNPNTGTSNTNTGKLTLASMYINYENSTRGSLSPYQFAYQKTFTLSSPNGTATGSFDYNRVNQDRWGNFKYNQTKTGVTGDAKACNYDDLMFPYVKQTSDVLISGGYNTYNSAANQPYYAYTPSVVDQADPKLRADAFAAAWNLNSIITPTGSQINVQYESDDYAFVQNDIAGQMFKISGSGGNGANDTLNDNDFNVYFDLETPLPVGTPLTSLIPYYEGLVSKPLENQPSRPSNEKYELYYKLKMNLRDAVDDYVSGYAYFGDGAVQFDPSTEFTNSQGVLCYRRAYINLSQTSVGGTTFSYHPFSLAGWQYMRATKNELITEPAGAYSNPNAGVAKQVMYDLLGSITTIGDAFTKFYTSCSNKGFCRKIDLNHSYVRLNTPTKFKYGGGARVKTLTINGDWYENGTDRPDSYGVGYDYTTTYTPMGGSPVTISSGVASYEPMIGGEENPLRSAKYYPSYISLNSFNNMYFEYPINENYYPAPVVGYSKVTVRSLTAYNQQQGTLPTDIPSTGAAVHEFYTAKDFPVTTEETNLNSPGTEYVWEPPAVSALFFSESTKDLTMSQGYKVETNNMHGKVKAVSNYAQGNDGSINLQNPVSSISYNYYASVIGQNQYDNSNIYRVFSGVDVLKNDGSSFIVTGNSGTSTSPVQNPNGYELGVDREFFLDSRESNASSLSDNVSIDVNLEEYFIAFIPIVMVLPSFSTTSTSLRMVSSNKVISRNGILRSMVATDQESSIETDNLLFDAISGEAVLTTVQNEFDAPVYNYDLPARWFYGNMGAAYKNINYTCTPSITTLGNNEADLGVSPSMVVHFALGDELLVSTTPTNSIKAYVTSINTTTNDVIITSDVAGASFPSSGSGSVNVEVVRSGYRNMLNTSAGSITALQNPLTRTSVTVPSCQCVCPGPANALQQVLASKAITFSGLWLLDQTKLNAVTQLPAIQAKTNLYSSGQAGVWRPSQFYAYKDYRSQTATDVNLSVDGTYTLPMFPYSNLSVLGCNPYTNWKLTNTVTKYSPNNYEVENIDILGNYNAALYGYDGKLNTGVIHNAQEVETGYAHFEDPEEAQNLVFPSSNSAYNSYISPEAYAVAPCEALLGPKGGQKQVSSGGVYGLGLKINAPYSDISNNIYSGAELVYSDASGNSYVVNINPGSLNFVANGNITEVVIPDSSVYLSNCSNPFTQLILNRVVSTTASDYALINTKHAHTGQQCLKIKSGYTAMQSNLQLQTGKKYFFSAWVSEDNTQVPSYGDISINIKGATYASGTYTTASTIVSLQPAGRVIEGWQRVEGSFTLPTGTNFVQLGFNSINGRSTNIYVDDVRIFPEAGNMKTFVYNPNDYKLRAVLDENNYATLYYYDDAGNLYLVKKETEKGISTIQESRSYVRHQ